MNQCAHIKPKQEYPLKAMTCKGLKPIRCDPTVLAVRLVLVLGVSECQRWIGPAGEAGAPLWGFSHISMAPKPPVVFRWCFSLTVVIQVLARTNREAAVRHAQVRAEGQAALWRWLVDPKVTQTEVLTWNKTTFSQKLNRSYVYRHIILHTYFSKFITYCVFCLFQAPVTDFRDL